MFFTAKSRPIAAGGQQEPKDLCAKPTPVPSPIVPPACPRVKWLESLRPGMMLRVGAAILAVIAVQTVPMGRMVTLSACRAAGGEKQNNEQTALRVYNRLVCTHQKQNGVIPASYSPTL